MKKSKLIKRTYRIFAEQDKQVKKQSSKKNSESNIVRQALSTHLKKE